jgi:peptidase E
MNIILSSKVFGDDIATKKIKHIIEKNFNELKVLLISTPCIPYGPEKYLNELLKCGFKEENIIIFDYKNAFKYNNLDIDVIYATGGNTFTGLKLIKECGFDKKIVNYINNNIMYIGRSAGAHLITKNVEHVLEFDSNDVGLSDYNALGIFDGILICHFDKTREEVYNRLLENKQYNVYTLTNQELLHITNERIEKL